VKSLHRLAFALTLVLIVAGCSTKSGGNVRTSGDRKAAPAFHLKDSTGGEVTLASLKGKVVLLNFWATWCGPCEVEIPWFIEFQQKYKDRGFEVVGVSFDDDGWTSVRPYMAAHKINYRIAIGSDELSQMYGGVDALPTSFVIDRMGRIAARHDGLVDKRDYQDEILKLLQDPKAAVIPGMAPDAGPDARAHASRLTLLVRPDQRP
jgi:peroxiredoxin